MSCTQLTNTRLSTNRYAYAKVQKPCEAQPRVKETTNNTPPLPYPFPSSIRSPAIDLDRKAGPTGVDYLPHGAATLIARSKRSLRNENNNETTNKQALRR